MCAYVGEGVSVDVYMGGGQKAASGVVLRKAVILFRTRVSHWHGVEQLGGAGWLLAGVLLCFPGTGITSVHHYTQHCYMVLGIKLRSSYVQGGHFRGK